MRKLKQKNLKTVNNAPKLLTFLAYYSLVCSQTKTHVSQFANIAIPFSFAGVATGQFFNLKGRSNVQFVTDLCISNAGKCHSSFFKYQMSI